MILRSWLEIYMGSCFPRKVVTMGEEILWRSAGDWHDIPEKAIVKVIAGNQELRVWIENGEINLESTGERDIEGLCTCDVQEEERSCSGCCK